MKNWILPAGVIYFAFVVLSAPATLLSSALKSVSGERVFLSECEGTLWRGTGVLTLVGPDSSGAALQARWSVRPLATLAGRVGFNIFAAGPGASVVGGVEIGPRSVALRNIEAAVPASWAALMNVPVPLSQLGGVLRLESPSLTVSRAAASGSAVVTWQNAASEQTGALGSYRATVTARGPQADVELATVSEGALSAEGRGSWETKSGATKFDGAFRATASAGALEPLLNMVGPERDGERPFTFIGNILGS